MGIERAHVLAPLVLALGDLVKLLFYARCEIVIHDVREVLQEKLRHHCAQTEVFPRIKVGVGEKPKKYDLADYVLSRFSKEERAIMEEGYQKAVEAVEMILRGEMEEAMNKFNRKVKPKEA